MNPWLLIFRLKALYLSDTVCIVKRVILTLNPMVETLVCDHSIGTVYNICPSLFYKTIMCDLNTLFCTSQVLNSILENTLLF